MIKGVTVQLETRKQNGTDAFNRPTYETGWEDVENVLIGEPSAEDAAEALDMTGKKLAYTLAVPKGDTHNWKDTRVKFFGETFRTVGEPTQGIEAMIPLSWNRKVQVERNE